MRKRCEINLLVRYPEDYRRLGVLSLDKSRVKLIIGFFTGHCNRNSLRSPVTSEIHLKVIWNYSHCTVWMIFLSTLQIVDKGMVVSVKYSGRYGTNYSRHLSFMEKKDMWNVSLFYLQPWVWRIHHYEYIISCTTLNLHRILIYFLIIMQLQIIF